MAVLFCVLPRPFLRIRYRSNVPVYEMMVPTANTECYSLLLETNLGAGRPTFLAGASGAGKTMLAAQVISYTH